MKAFAGPHREVRVQRSVLVRRQVPDTYIIKSAAAADDHNDAALSYDQRSVRAGRPSARPRNIVVTLSFASMNFTG